MFSGKKVVFGITGGIAAYKAADVVSWLAKNGAEVHVVMTENAAKIISPLTLQTLSKRPVVLDEFAEGFGWQVVHITLVQDADLFAVIPATANFMAKAAGGIADDAITSSVLAATCPMLVAPAMNMHMYENPATQRNLQILRQRGWSIVEPATGMLACGYEGKGKLPDLAVLQSALTEALLPKQDFGGKKILVTAGPTVEAIDPVRYISNRSSGKMGYAVAKAAAKRGAEVVLVSGPTSLQAPVYGDKIRTVRITSAEAMQAAVLAEYDSCDAVIKAAAVADYRVAEQSPVKIKKQETEMTLRLIKNPDILKELGHRKKHQILVGFAAETNNLQDYAKKKLKEKNLDLIVANDVSRSDAGFDVDTNVITLIKSDGTVKEYDKCSKEQAAENILDALSPLL
ncbi:MAG: bifunctional phosphopantothenoylcysteine decarboxylase/phosphopantothenate--cysteine ligase CoaBC [Bacillota bacterium]|jgi:phosphopantothenoylcysteine decarboxylase/phosphopantothenate--cysteine ligase